MTVDSGQGCREGVGSVVVRAPQSNISLTFLPLSADVSKYLQHHASASESSVEAVRRLGARGGRTESPWTVPTSCPPPPSPLASLSPPKPLSGGAISRGRAARDTTPTYLVCAHHSTVYSRASKLLTLPAEVGRGQDGIGWARRRWRLPKPILQSLEGLLRGNIEH